MVATIQHIEFLLFGGYYMICLQISRENQNLVLLVAFYILLCMSQKKISILLIDDDQ